MTLLEKLLEIRKAMPYLKKENLNEGQGFNYVSSSQALKVFREKADELGVFIIPHVTNATTRKPKGSKQLLTELLITYDIVNVEDPNDKLSVSFYAQGMDITEKGVGKALTYGEKYLILKLFNVPTDLDDPDAAPATTTTTRSPGDAGEKVDDDTARFMAAMNKITDAYIKRDGHANAVGMMVRVMGHKEVADVAKQEDRVKLVGTLLEELGVKTIGELETKNAA